MNIQESITMAFKGKGAFTLDEAYAVSGALKHSTRARIYENIGVHFKRIKRGMYEIIEEGVLLIEGNGRDLSFLPDSSISLLCTDSPWLDNASNKGGDRNFANTYETFLYEQSDFDEKARVLKQGHFMIEMLPTEKESNWKYLNSIKVMAEKAGLILFTKTIWKKGNKPYNTGRNQSNLLDILIFSKGKARNLRPDKKKIKALGGMHYMSGANAIVPSILDVEPPNKNDAIHQSEKPVMLLVKLLELFSLSGEMCVDQFAGSGSFGEACIVAKRPCVLIELMHENIEKIKHRLKNI